MKVIDNNGNIYKSVREFCRKKRCSRSHLREQMRQNGFYYNKAQGITLRYINDEDGNEESIEEQDTLTKEDKAYKEVLDVMRERYSLRELKLISKGKGLEDPNLKYPEIHLTGRHHKIGVISDGHLGSKYSPLEFHYQAFETFEKEKCECVLHCGDLVEGLCPKRTETQIYELSHIGYSQQRDLAIEVFSHCKLPVYCISGNHDSWYFSMGGNIVKEICQALPNMTYLGHNQSDIHIDGTSIRLFHGTDGNSYAYSYRLQKLIESFTIGKKPNILLCGHTHKMCYIYDRGIQCLSVPSLQMQTEWMRSKKIAAHTGFAIIEFDVYNGNVSNFSVRIFPFYA